jgi:hypothetical protein
VITAAACSLIEKPVKGSREVSIDMRPSNLRLKLSARGRRSGRNAQWEPSILIAAPAGRSLSATR